MTTQIQEFFSPTGPLTRLLKPYEMRPGQVALAHAVAETLHTRGKLLAEAGTGIGKTMAYLAAALQSDLKVVVSTGTKNLQDQLVHKDLPLVQRALGRRFAVEVMKGRVNYLCEVRAEAAFAQGLLPGMPGVAELKRLRTWRHQTHSGDRSELRDLADDAPIWRHVSATSEQCLGRACDQYERCWVTQMRQRAKQADVVVVNHHLYLADAALRQAVGEDGVALLPPHDLVIFDEAHELDDIAAQHFGYQVSERNLHDLEDDVTTGLDAHAVARNSLKPAFQELKRAGRVLFDQLPFELGRVRLRDADVTEAVQHAQQDVDAVLQRIESELAAIKSDEAKTLARRTALMAAQLAFVLNLPQRGALTHEIDLTRGTDADQAPYVRYGEATARHRTLVARPVDVAPLLGRTLKATPAVFVSATLRIGGSFSHFRKRVGLGEVTELCVESPFDYEAQVSLYLPDDLPEPENPQFVSQAVARVGQLLTAAGGGAFVLCTSHKALAAMRAAALATGLGPVLTQGEAPKGQLVQTFRAAKNAILVATMSFWKGVDVPGHALRLVIIDKLPFASPQDPLVEARMEHLVAQGLDPFMTYQVPQTALLLRQGFGRLIRRQTDQGMVAILDRRLRTRRYGPLLLRSLPRCRRIADLEEALHALKIRRAPQGLAEYKESTVPFHSDTPQPRSR